MFERCTFLAFHQTSGKFYPGINNIRPDRFWPLLQLIESWGLSIYGDGEGDTADPIRQLVLTFDDGYHDQYDILIRLCDRGIKPILFIPPAYIGKYNRWEYSSRFFPSQHLDEKQIGKLADLGVIIGSHGWSHRSLTGMNHEAVLTELQQSKKTLEEITARAVEYISFPFGRTNAAINSAARQFGYQRGFVLDSARRFPEDAGFILPRIPVYGIDDYYSLKGKLVDQSRLERIKNRIINDLAGGTIITSRKLK